MPAPRWGKQGKKYLYDLIKIKQDKSSKLSQSWKTKIDKVRSTYPAVDTIPQVIDDVKFRGQKSKDDTIDADYLSAVERGDTATAQRFSELMDEARTEMEESGQKNNTHGVRYSVNETYSIKPYSEKQKDQWKNSKNSILYKDKAHFEKFIADALKQDHGQKLYFGRIDEELAAFIHLHTGIDLKNYNLVLRASEVKKILLHSHGSQRKENLRGQRVIEKDDFLNIPTIITSPDTICLSDKLFEGKPVIEFVKTINGKTTIVTYVSRKHYDLTVQTIYSGRNKKSLSTTPSGEISLSQTSKTLSGTAFKNSVPQSSEKSNIPDGRKSKDDTIDADYLSAVERGDTETEAPVSKATKNRLSSLEASVEDSIPQSSEKSNIPDGRKSKDTIDADYLSAVERGDMETAQRMVDEGRFLYCYRPFFMLK